MSLALIHVKSPIGAEKWSATSPYELPQRAHVAELVSISTHEQEQFFMKKSDALVKLGIAEPSEDRLVQTFVKLTSICRPNRFESFMTEFNNASPKLTNLLWLDDNWLVQGYRFSRSLGANEIAVDGGAIFPEGNVSQKGADAAVKFIRSLCSWLILEETGQGPSPGSSSSATLSTGPLHQLRGGKVEKKTARGVPSRGGGGGGQPTRGRGGNNKFGNRRGQGKRGRKWVRKCFTCARINRQRKAVPPLKPILSKCPYELGGIDVFSLGQTSSGHRYVVTVIDHYSKFCAAYPVADKTAKTIAKVFWENWCLREGRMPTVFCPIVEVNS